jgi:hypothetical protein
MTQIPTETRSTRFAKAKKTAQTLKVPPLKSLFLSANSKTGFSINTAIPLTCRPTAACAQYCYGLEGRSIMLPAFRRQIGNAQRFAALESAPDLNLIYEAIGVAEQVLPKQNFLRFFGVGDLQPGSVRFINTLSMTVPELTLLAVSIWLSGLLRGRTFTSCSAWTLRRGPSTSKTFDRSSNNDRGTSRPGSSGKPKSTFLLGCPSSSRSTTSVTGQPGVDSEPMPVCAALQ